jgi:apolipoprotein N-acyltransferase
MNSRFGQIAFKILLAVASGVVLRQVVGLRPDWWAVWFAPALLLIIALRLPGRDARWMVPLAAVIATSCNIHYFRLVMPLPAVIATIAAQSLLWVLLVFATQRVVLRYRAWWIVFVYPGLWVAVDTLTATLLPDGNWGSLAYSQGDKLPTLQIASLFGTAGVLFLLALVPSAIALAISLGTSLRRGWIAYSLTALLLASSLLFGYLRLRQPVRGVETTFGIVSIDDPIGLHTSVSYAANIFSRYDWRVAALAEEGAQVVVLPEKIAMLTPSSALDQQHRFSALASENHVWLEVGVGIDDGKTRTNWEWLFAPDGSLAAIYEKHHMAPPKRRDHYVSGTEYTVYSVNGQNYGLAVCKDMHFAALGRAYGQRHVSVMLVPAWDFDYLDGWIEARTTIMRGIENGYSIVRASREGLLTASDPYGRVLAETPSGTMRGHSLLVKVVVAAPVPTLYTRIGNTFGWLWVIAAAVLLLVGRWRREIRRAVTHEARASKEFHPTT